MKQDVFFKPMHYNKMLSKYFMNTYYVNFFYEETDFKSKFLEIRNKDAYKNFDIFFRDEKMWKEGITKEEIDKNIKKMKEAQAVENEKDVNNFLIIFYNKTLIMMCTIFDIFLVDCAEVIIDNNQKTIKAFANDNDVLLDDLINVDPEDVFKNIQKKCLKRFDFGGIEDKIKYLNKLGIKKEMLFKFNDKMIKQFPQAEEFLKKEIYERRHSIVHKNEMSIKNFEDLSKVFNFLNYLIILWGGLVFTKHFNITSDLILSIKDK